MKAFFRLIPTPVPRRSKLRQRPILFVHLPVGRQVRGRKIVETKKIMGFLPDSYRDSQELFNEPTMPTLTGGNLPVFLKFRDIIYKIVENDGLSGNRFVLGHFFEVQ